MKEANEFLDAQESFNDGPHRPRGVDAQLIAAATALGAAITQRRASISTPPRVRDKVVVSEGSSSTPQDEVQLLKEELEALREQDRQLELEKKRLMLKGKAKTPKREPAPPPPEEEPEFFQRFKQITQQRKQPRPDEGGGSSRSEAGVPTGGAPGAASMLESPPLTPGAGGSRACCRPV